MTLLDALLTVMLILAPSGEYYGLAMANEKILMQEKPLFASDASRSISAALLLSVQLRESRLNAKATGDCPGMKPGSNACTAETARSFCAMQLQGRADANGSIDTCVRDGFALIHLSMKLCKGSPVEERLAYYARGRCDSEEGKRISRDRFALAKRIQVKLEKVMGGVL